MQKLCRQTPVKPTVIFAIPMVFMMVFGLVSCGGAPLQNENYLERNGLGQTVAVTVVGLEGSVVVSVGDRRLVFNQDGTTSEGGLPQGELTARIESSPDGQDCLFSPSNLSEIIAGPAITVSCAAPGITGSVINFFTGDVVSGAEISVYEVVEGESSLFTTVNSGTDGAYEVTDTVAGNRYVLSVSAAGFAPQTVIGLPLESRPAAVENISLVPENESLTVDPASIMTFTAGGVTVLQVPANGLVNADGGAPVGEVTARITFLDPSSGNSALPGRYDLSSGSPIEMFGGVAIVVTDSEGTSMRLAEGVTASLKIPVATKSLEGSPSSASLYLFNERSGFWEGGATASLSDEGGVSVYTTTTTSLVDVFVSGAEYQSVLVEGCIEDAGGNPVVGVTVVSQGNNYLGLGYSVTDSAGAFSVSAKIDSEVFVYGLLGARSRTATVQTSTSNAVISGCLLFDFSSVAISLTWGETPSDLDSHLYGPQPDSSDRFHVDWTQRSVTVGTQTIFLDVDDVTSFGPEITTIPSFPEEGTYEFLVHNYSGSGSIAESPARVELNSQGDNFAFSPPDGTPTLCWHVFNIVVDSALRGTVETVNEWLEESVCTTTGTVGLTVGVQNSPDVEASSPATQAILQKYYAQ